MTRHVSPPSFSVVTVGGPRSEESERNTTPRGRREARGEESLVLNGVRVSGGLKKVCKDSFSLASISVKEVTKLCGGEMSNSDEDAFETE